MSDELRPCPFCGRGALELDEKFAWGHAERSVQVRCGCGARGPLACHSDVDEDAFRDVIPEAMRQDMRALARRWWNESRPADAAVVE